MLSNRITRGFLFTASLLVLILSAAIVFSLTKGSLPAFREFGLKFIITNEWNPTEGKEVYGALPFISGTLATSVMALILSLPLAFSTSLFIAEYFRDSKISSILSSLIDLLAGIPSIIYGLWGFYTLRPLIISLGLSDQGFGIFTSSLILAIMIIPYATSMSTEIIGMVPSELKEAAYSLGATRLEVIWNVIIPNARFRHYCQLYSCFRKGIGETMAVTMLIGNSNNVPSGII